MKFFLFTLALFLNVAHAADPSVLSNTDHAVGNIQATITALGISGVNIDQTCGTGTGSPVCGAEGSFVTPGAPFINYALGSGPFYAAGTATPDNHQPYTLITESSTNYSITLDQANYALLVANGILYSMPHCPSAPGIPDYPPVAMVNVLPFGSAAGPGCGYDSGIEFSLSTNYLYSGSTASPSSTGATMAGILEAMKANQPTWTWNDIKGALRQTASNWSGGYTPNNSGALGFGNVNFAAATAVSGTSAIYLQGPGMRLVPHPGYVTVTLYPYLSTRRVKEVVYIGGTWPAASTVNELSAAQITAAGGTLIYTSNGTDVTPTFNYAPAASGSATFYALTLDSSGNGSRIESYSAQTQSFTIGTACLQ